ncbi:MAG: class I SAM-dependent methyltransferase [Actinomycetota bacterium]|nr:class I SAM-dependent methyltransferase [Actinomycetota bacterium]
MADTQTTCRSCGGASVRPFLSLGKTPLADALVTEESLNQPELRFPLDVAFCEECSLVQILEEVPPEQLFVENYLYFSSFSEHLLKHSGDHAAGLIRSRNLGPGSLVVEVASNDGYLLRNFRDAGIPVLGIDPAPDQAAAAREAGIPTLEEFFGTDMAWRLRGEGRRADVIVANNVMAHVPDLNGFVEGIRVLLADDGIATIENPYVRDLVDGCEFDTIYHEHFCYFSCTAVDHLMRRHGLYLNHVEHFPDLHGGTLRWYVGPKEDVSDAVRTYLADERARGLTEFSYYAGFADRVDGIKRDLLALLQRLKSEGATIAAYGAAAKGSTLVNSVGIGTELVDFVVDRNVHKQGRYMPGTHLPIRDPSVLLDEQPDYLLLLAWNFEKEIREQQAEYLRRGGRFVIPVPTPAVT